jgi:hypothetical protein
MPAVAGIATVERFTHVGARTLRYRVTVDDPDTWAIPWTAEWSSVRQRPDVRSRMSRGQLRD